MIQQRSIPIQGADIYCEFESDIGPVAEYPRFEYSMKDVKRAGEIIAGELPCEEGEFAPVEGTRLADILGLPDPWPPEDKAG